MRCSFREAVLPHQNVRHLEVSQPKPGVKGHCGIEMVQGLALGFEFERQYAQVVMRDSTARRHAEHLLVLLDGAFQVTRLRHSNS